MDLRSSKREHHIPVQLQLVKDDDFLAETLASSTGTGQVFDSEPSDDSILYIDISALLDQKLSSLSMHSVNNAKAGGSGLASGGTGGKGSNSSVSQNDINQIILAPLSSLGEHLDSMEENMSKVCPRKQVICQRSEAWPINQNMLKLKSHLMGLAQMTFVPLAQCITFHL